MGGTRRQGHTGFWLGNSRFVLYPALLAVAGACGDPGEQLFSPDSGGSAGASAQGGGVRGGAPPGEGGIGGTAAAGRNGASGGRAGAGGHSAGGGPALGGAAGKAGTGGSRPGAGGESGSSTQGGGGSLSGGHGSGEGEGDGGISGEGGDGSTSPFDCDNFDGRGVSARCFDFGASDSSTRWLAEGGQWAVSSGAYVGSGPASPLSCVQTGSQITAALVAGFSARDLRLHAQLTGVERADKVVVLRARDPQNRVELNFRARFDDGGTTRGGDLVIQELRDCLQTLHVGPGTLSIPHELSQTLVVDIELRGPSLGVWVDGRRIFDGEVPISATAGAVGVGVITGGTTRFDDVFVQSVD